MIYGIDSNSPSATLVAAITTLTTTSVPEWVWSGAAGQSSGAAVQFVARYLSYHGNANLNVTEVMALTDNGLRAVSIFEAGNDIDSLTEANGYAHATEAWTAAQRLSQPLNTPIYFAVDVSPTMAQLPMVTAYFEGVRRSLNDYNASCSSSTDVYAIGVYGQPHVLTNCRDTESTTTPGNKLATFFWRWGGSGAWAGAAFQQLYGENFYSDRDPTKHFIDSTTGHVVGEKFCGLSVDFNISEMDTLDLIGAWVIPAAPPASNDDGSGGGGQ
jgi:hypothetical protein